MGLPSGFILISIAVDLGQLLELTSHRVSAGRLQYKYIYM